MMWEVEKATKSPQKLNEENIGFYQFPHKEHNTLELGDSKGDFCLRVV